MILHFSIPRVPVGPNGPKGLFRMGWQARRRLSITWAWEIKAAVSELAHGNRLFNEHRSRRAVKIHHVRSRHLDPDNLVASCKPILDGLRKNLLIVDDNAKWIDLHVSQQVGKPVRTEISIEDL